MRDKILILGFLLVVLASSGCTGGTTTTEQLSEMTPSEVVETYGMAHQRQDFDKMYVFMSENFKNRTSVDEFRRDVNNVDAALASKGISFSFKRVLNEEISGNKATVEFEYEMSTMTMRGLLRTTTVTLVKEETGWKFTRTISLL
jgi:NTF2-like N-terminal transpeptidase domain